MDAAELGVEVFNLTLVCASDERVIKPAVQAFSLSAQFALAMLKLPEEWRRWGESKGVGRERGERRDFFLPSPFPLSFFRPRTYRKGYYYFLLWLSPIFHCHKIKDGGYNNVTNTNKVSPTQNTPALQATSNLPPTSRSSSPTSLTRKLYDLFYRQLRETQMYVGPKILIMLCEEFF